MRRWVADLTAGILAVAVLGLGGLVVVKPALDDWDALYRASPFETATTTKKFREKHDRLTAIATTKQKPSAIERVLAPSGLLLLRLSLVALAAFLLAAVLHRAILADYRLGVRRTGARTPSEAVGDSLNGSVEPKEPKQAELAHDGPTAPELGTASLAPPIAKLVASRREELGLSQRELAKRAGISHTVVSRIEQGEQTPSRKTLERLADALRAQ
jgi:DNA-binding XRE family transcriptional regulator